jgi:hypothetical protein
VSTAAAGYVWLAPDVGRDGFPAHKLLLLKLLKLLLLLECPGCCCSAIAHGVAAKKLLAWP